MLDELKQIVGRLLDEAVDMAPLRQRFGPGREPASPAQVAEFAALYCAQALAQAPADVGADTAAEEGGWSLLHFIAELPAPIADEIGRITDFRETVERAWLEPQADAYVGLCNATHDVWAHLLGQESADDARILAALDRRAGIATLDFGAGCGHFATQLAMGGARVDVVEVDPVKLAFLQFRSRRLGLDIHCGMRDAPYQQILAINVLDHLRDPDAALQQLTEGLQAGGLLHLLAEFPADGWHQADPAKVQACAALLNRHYVRQAPSDVPWLDSYTRAAAPQAVFGGRPALHPRASLIPQQGKPEIILSSTAFYARPCALDHQTAMLCGELDGSRTLQTLSTDLDLELDELAAFCDFLQQHGQLTWFPERQPH
ncbi:class I SAM-dependent methyltransferase [Chromobacterium sp. CV08]|uniref:class I SAM-dependent methyltransferase n=1 Tax=Chromobacterium sp. CV08 TaxID=3133274 RepID=UPI003DA82CFE